MRIFLAYDIPSGYDKEKGRGVMPKRARNYIRSLRRAGLLTKVQNSLLEVEEPEVLDSLLKVLADYNAHVLVFRVLSVEEYGEPLHNKR